MFEKGKTYKIKTRDSIYTATVIEWDTPLLKIRDKFGKELVLNIEYIDKSYEVE